MPIQLTEASLRRVFPRGRQSYIDALLQEQAFLASHGVLDNPLRWCHFCAQIGHETGGLRIVREDMRYSAKRIMQIFGLGRHSARVMWGEAAKLAGKPYELAERVYGIGNPSMARRLGNTKAGDGYAYRGWGPGQVTGKGQSLRYGGALGLDLEANPELLEDAATGLKAFVLEWDERNLNAYADRNQGDAVSKGVNLGNPRHKAKPNGLADRRAWYRKAWAEWRDADAGAEATEIARTTNWLVLRVGDDSTEVRAMQERLTALGYHLGHVDGVFGKETERQVRAFQGDAGLTADGIVGPVTWAALRTTDQIDRGARTEVTADELAARGSRQVAEARAQKARGMWANLTGWFTIGGALAMPETLSKVPEWVGQVRETAESFSTALAWVVTPTGLACCAGAVLIWYGTSVWRGGQRTEDIRVDEARTGANLSK